MSQKIRSADTLVKIALEDSAKLSALKDNPVSELMKLKDEAINQTPESFATDKMIYRVAIFTLAFITICAIVGMIALIFTDKLIPESLVAIGSTAVGAIAGLFVPSPVGE